MVIQTCVVLILDHTQWLGRPYQNLLSNRYWIATVPRVDCTRSAVASHTLNVY